MIFLKNFKLIKFLSVFFYEMKKYLNKDYLNLYILLFLPIILYFVVKSLVHYNTHSICIFKIITGNNCWGCGMTRAFNELFSFRFKEAYDYNPRIVIVAPLLFYLWISTLIREIKRKIKTIDTNRSVVEDKRERGLL